ncbi:MAG: tRNA dihydrouridine(20/20a) synthase DusA [Steroidobacterales bacterium]
MKGLDRRLCVAPMMEWTDRHCRYLHRQFSPHALLYTEMIVAAALVRGDAARLLEHDAGEQPLALQLGGCDPHELAQAAGIGAAAGYAEINLNVGCPSDRVRQGAFGACLMANAPLVAECVARMRDAVDVSVTVKCRIGIDTQDDYGFFAAFAAQMQAAGVAALIVHARSAILGGLSPKQNREIPPLRYDYVHRLKRERPSLNVVLNGGLNDRAQVLAELAADPHGAALDGVMLGRAAYHRPTLIGELEQALIDVQWQSPGTEEVIERMVAYARGQARRGVRLHSITRHMHGLIAGCDGARAWRRFLSEVAARPDARPETLYAALPILARRIAA